MRRKGSPIDAANLQAGQDSTIIFPAEGPVNRENLGEKIEVVPGPKLNTKAKAEAFNHEDIIIRLHTTNDKNAERYPMVSVGGRKIYFQRGVQTKVQRKFVEQLARMKKDTIDTREVVDADGAKTTAIDRMSALKYPFELLRDDNPRGGHEWLEAILMQP